MTDLKPYPKRDKSLMRKNLISKALSRIVPSLQAASKQINTIQIQSKVNRFHLHSGNPKLTAMQIPVGVRQSLKHDLAKGLNHLADYLERYSKRMK
jgi:hypothetical protein